MKMFSIVETLENGKLMAVAVKTIWMKNGKLYWPPGKNPDSRIPSSPQVTWTTFNYKLLRTGIVLCYSVPLYYVLTSNPQETFEEALEYQKLYSKHRKSDSFREEQAKKRVKREHPVEGSLIQNGTKRRYHNRSGSSKPLKAACESRNAQKTRARKCIQKKGKENFMMAKSTATSTVTSSTSSNTSSQSQSIIKAIGQIEVTAAGENLATNILASNSILEPTLPKIEVVPAKNKLSEVSIAQEILNASDLILSADDLQSDAAFNELFDGLLNVNNVNQNIENFPIIGDVDEVLPPNGTGNKLADVDSNIAAHERCPNENTTEKQVADSCNIN